MENIYKQDEGNDCMLSVDGVDCRIEKPAVTKWASHKFKYKPGVRYELGVGIKSGDICWLNGPYPAGEYPDIKIFTETLMQELDEGERVETDKGYRGHTTKCKVPGPLYADQVQYLEMKKRVAARHETINNRLKFFTCLDKRFRHSMAKHASCFRAVCVLVQLSFESGEPAFNVDYSDLKN